MPVEQRTFRQIEDTSVFALRPPDPLDCQKEEARKAVEIAHGRELDRIAACLKRGQSVLVECDKSLVNYILESLAHPEGPGGAEARLPSMTPLYVGFNQAAPRPPDSVLYHQVALIAGHFKAARGKPNQMVVIPHLELMTWNLNEQPRQELNDILYWLAEFPSVVRIAFWDPVFTLPRVLATQFPNHVTIRTFDREVLWKLLSPVEARKVAGSTEGLSVAAQSTLYQYLAGTNIIEVRRILRSIADNTDLLECIPDTALVYQFIRGETGATAMVELGRVEGYDDVRETLYREVIFPVGLRRDARTTDELRRADALAPRGVLLAGPPGVGKSEWAKWLAVQLNTPLFVIHGPELKSRWVGETEAAIRRVVAAARRAAPSVILIDEIDSMTPSRREDASNFERSMVNQLLTEMDGLRREETVIFVGTTNVPKLVDDAFLRPGRFGTVIEVGYPTLEDRRKILAFYSSMFLLSLTSQEIGDLANLSGENFAGDHLRAVCQCLSRERLYRQTERGKSLDPFKLEDAVEAVRNAPAGGRLPRPGPAKGTWRR